MRVEQQSGKDSGIALAGRCGSDCYNFFFFAIVDQKSSPIQGSKWVLTDGSPPPRSSRDELPPPPCLVNQSLCATRGEFLSPNVQREVLGDSSGPGSISSLVGMYNRLFVGLFSQSDPDLFSIQ